MKQTDYYETPETEVISFELTSILNASEPEHDISGDVMDFYNVEGRW